MADAYLSSSKMTNSQNGRVDLAIVSMLQGHAQVSSPPLEQHNAAHHSNDLHVQPKLELPDTG